VGLQQLAQARRHLQHAVLLRRAALGLAAAETPGGAGRARRRPQQGGQQQGRGKGALDQSLTDSWSRRSRSSTARKKGVASLARATARP
jgi:hypothetical protein